MLLSNMQIVIGIFAQEIFHQYGDQNLQVIEFDLQKKKCFVFVN